MSTFDRACVRPVIAIFGSGTVEPSPAQKERITQVAQWIATNGCHLLTGGGWGVMEVASEAFCRTLPREGLCIGILPEGRDPARYPNRWVELPIYTHLRGDDPLGPDSRNHINVRSAHAIVAFPGAHGTIAEVQLALKCGRPLVACVRESEGETIGGLTATELAELGVSVMPTADDVVRWLASIVPKEPYSS